MLPQGSAHAASKLLTPRAPVWATALSPGQKRGSSQALQDAARERHLQMCAQLLLWQRLSVVRSLDKCPQLLHMTPQELSLRLASIKACLPECDVSDLVKSRPASFLHAEQSAMEAQISSNYAQLVEQLPRGFDIFSLIQEQPAILFHNPAALQGALKFAEGAAPLDSLDSWDAVDVVSTLLNTFLPKEEDREAGPWQRLQELVPQALLIGLLCVACCALYGASS
ncbi:hypothetical protein WJX73_006689 [Symbiochloris irregularis]|uniref:Uncharacterized protein n=1 Tax=Symbiochloris irregularis TaxID=706552 RepID=A0AAW1PHF8_9CHLO